MILQRFDIFSGIIIITITITITTVLVCFALFCLFGFMIQAYSPNVNNPNALSILSTACMTGLSRITLRKIDAAFGCFSLILVSAFCYSKGARAWLQLTYIYFVSLDMLLFVSHWFPGHILLYKGLLRSLGELAVVFSITPLFYYHRGFDIYIPHHKAGTDKSDM